MTLLHVIKYDLYIFINLISLFKMWGHAQTFNNIFTRKFIYTNFSLCGFECIAIMDFFSDKIFLIILCASVYKVDNLFTITRTHSLAHAYLSCIYRNLSKLIIFRSNGIFISKVVILTWFYSHKSKFHYRLYSPLFLLTCISFL